MPKQDGAIRNLDTGEERRLGEGALTRSFLKGEYVAPGALANKRPHWVRWRAEKRANEEMLWSAAESGSTNMLREALTISEDGSTPKASVNAPSLYGRAAPSSGACRQPKRYGVGVSFVFQGDH